MTYTQPRRPLVARPYAPLVGAGPEPIEPTVLTKSASLAVAVGVNTAVLAGAIYVGRKLGTKSILGDALAGTAGLLSVSLIANALLRA